MPSRPVFSRAVAAVRAGRPGAHRTRRGYTLVEILIVVVIMGIAGALVIPSMGATDVLRVQSVVRTIVADINFAQSDGLARQEGRAIVFDPDANSYALVEVHGSTLDPGTDTIYEVKLTNTVKFGDARIVSAEFDGDPVLVFDEMGGPVTEPDGTTPSGGGTIVVTGSGSQYEIEIEAYTGRVTVTQTGP